MTRPRLRTMGADTPLTLFMQARPGFVRESGCGSLQLHRSDLGVFEFDRASWADVL